MRATAQVVTGGALGEFVAGAAGVVLAIIGLAGIFPAYVAPIAALAIGAALLLQGGATSARFRRLLNEVTESTAQSAELSGGVSAELVGGAGAIVLGVLALIGVEVTVLLAVAAIVLGGTVALSSGAASRLGALGVPEDAHHLVREISREAVKASAGAQLLVGGAAIVLGILALVGVSPDELTLVAFLAVGSSVVLSAAAVSGRLGMYFESTS
jgi:hypothetical protein